MTAERKSAVLFHSTNHAIWTAKLLKKRGIRHKMISVPRHLSSDCGYCVEILSDDEVFVEGILKENGVEYERIEAL
ncbi:MAG: DUF3343 domain-containing protein [Spirochaetes bacterium]|nr:DUF3343 domain-containing protein [Spirochaetota bacterium]